MTEQTIENIPRAVRVAPAVKAVLDTSVLRSAVWGGRASTTVVDAWLEGRVHFCVTESIMKEYFDALMRLEASPLVQTVLRSLRQGDNVRAYLPTHSIQHHGGPPEDRLLNCARVAHAVAVVTHDKSLLHLTRVGSVAMSTPGAFIRNFL